MTEQTIVPPPNWTKNAILVYGPKKAGTTLLQNLHDGGEDLFMYPVEAKLKYLVDEMWSNINHISTYCSYVELDSIELPNFDHKKYKKNIASLHEDAINSLRDLIIADISAVYSAVNNKPAHPKMWGVKEVGGKTERILQLWKQMFITGKIVLILRDPLMVARSVLQVRSRQGTKSTLKETYIQVSSSFNVLRAQLKFANNPDVHIVLYEELVNDHKKEMKGIADFLDIKYKDILNIPTIFGEPVVTATSSKNEKKVFKSGKKWYNDLTVKEKLVVFCVQLYLKLKFTFCKNSKYGFPNYNTVCKKLNNLKNSKKA